MFFLINQKNENGSFSNQRIFQAIHNLFQHNPGNNQDCIHFQDKDILPIDNNQEYLLQLMNNLYHQFLNIKFHLN